MLNRIRKIYKIIYIKRLKKRGLSVGRNFQMEKGCNIDANFPWLITIGNDVTFASWVYLTAHDGAAQKHVGYSKIGGITIGDNVFIGARSIVLPNVSIGANSVIGAGSVVTKSIPENVVASGVPAKVLMSIDEYERRLKNDMDKLPVFEQDYTLLGGITEERKREMKDKLNSSGGFIV